MRWAIRTNSSEELSMSERECHSEKSQNNPSREFGSLQTIITLLDARSDLNAFCICIYVPLQVENTREYTLCAYFRSDNAVDLSTRTMGVAPQLFTLPPVTEQELNNEDI